MSDLTEVIAKFVSDHDRERLRAAIDNLGIDLSTVDLSLVNTPDKVRSELANVIALAQSAGLTTVYYTATTMAANGRYTLLTYDGRKPQVICNPAGVAALVEACEAAGIECVALTPEMAGLK